MKKLTAILLALVLLCGTAALADGLPAGMSKLPDGVTPLPIDFTGGYELQESGFGDVNWYYSDPSITLEITTGREAGCDWWIASIKIADPSQLRTVSAGGFDTANTVKGTILAADMNAVLAIAGDYYTDTGMGVIRRQGILYKSLLEKDVNNRRDLLSIDANGDFHVYYLPGPDDEIPSEINGVKVLNTFYFGPVLVDNGEVVKNVNVNKVTANTMVAEKKRQRVAICQCGPLSYKIIMCGPPARGNAGMTLQQFADLVARQEDVQIAYNMDGGDSAMMIFNGTKINDVRSTSVRPIEDIIYFASAYKGDAE